MIPAHIRSEIQRAVDGARYEANVVAEVRGVGLESSTLFKLAAHLQEVLDRDEAEHAAEVAGGYGGRRKLTDYLPEDERPTDVEMNQLRAYWLTGRGSESFASVQRQAESQIGTEMHKLVEKLRDRVDQQISEQLQALPEQQRTWLRARWEQGEVELTTVVDPVDFTSNSYSMTVELRPKMMHDFATIYGRHSTFHERDEDYAALFTEPEMTVVGQREILAVVPDQTDEVCGCSPEGEPQASDACGIIGDHAPPPPFDHQHNLSAFNCLERPIWADYLLDVWCLACGGKPKLNPYPIY